MKQLQDFIKVFTDDEIGGIVKVKNSFYSIENDLIAVKDRSKKDIFAGGMFLGEWQGNGFKPSISLIDWLARRSSRKIFVSRKTAWLFLCGRDLFNSGIVRSDVKEGLVLVQNEEDENLGYGKMVDDSGKKSKVVVENLLDKGNFLRREH